MSEYKLTLGKTLKYSSPSITKFWLRDFGRLHGPGKLYSLDYNAEILKEEYQAIIIRNNDNNSYIVFPDLESYMRFQIEWA